MTDFDFTNLVILEFYGEGCLNCQLMKPVLTNLEHDFPSIRFYHIDADAHHDLVQHYQITSIPCLLIFQQGQKLAEITGVKSQNTLEQIIKGILNV